MTQVNKNVVVTFALLLLAAGGYFAWQSRQATAAPAYAKPKFSDTLHFDLNAPQLDSLQIKPVHLFPAPLSEPLSARIAYDDDHTAHIFSPVSGRITKIDVDVGQRVKAGQPLLQLDSPDYASAVSDSVKADADLKQKQEAYDRANQLYANQGIALRDLQSAEADWQQAQAESLRAQAHLHNLESTSKTTNGQFELRSPISGIVSERQVSAGTEVSQGASNSLFVVTNLQHLWAMVDLPESDLTKVKVGQPVFVEVDAYPGETFHGRVTAVGTTLDPVTRRIQVRCYVNNPDGKLKPEMFARVTPDIDNDKQLPRVPNTALLTVGMNTYVFVELSPGVLQRRKVELSIQDADYSYVKSGLQPDERIVTSGALLLNSELSGDD